jgi:predicted DNA-binding transcriptional regulator AlpA
MMSSCEDSAPGMTLDKIRATVSDVLASASLTDSQTPPALLALVKGANLKQVLAAALSVGREQARQIAELERALDSEAQRDPRRMLTEVQVLDLVPFGRTTLNNLIKTGAFPRGTYVSPNRRAWFADQIASWQNALSEHNPLYNPNRGRGKGRRPRVLAMKGR